ncbi:hypothetical protein C6569_09300 [Phreatobacter cathodiphilus]|uniref:Uncharacterized protein n=1 Tax=Phreatobacter cathodiphilus TaxID=1868589 RepID=A0A2S0NBD5_9HYPH|nr:hypothetical protein C6569_09300 [Phreatobacter cathodiphilus]
MQISSLPIADAWAAMQPYVARAYSGHFAPIAFTAEVLVSKLLGANETAWFVRQCLALSIFATVTTAALREANPANTVFGSACLAAILVFHPFAADLMSWPFMVMQIACLTCASAAAMFLARFSRDPSARTAWLCAMSGYAAMHFFGVGLAISAATLLALFLTAWAQSSGRFAKWPLIVGTVLTALHAIPIMLRGGGADGAVQWVDSVRRLLVLLVEQPIAALRATFATPWVMQPDLSIPATQAVWGGAFAAMAAIGLVACWRKASIERTPGTVPIVTLALGAYVLTCGLIAARLRAETGAATLVAFLIGGRYLIFPIFYAVLAAGTLRVPAYVYAVGAAGMMISTAVFVRFVAPTLWPSFFP